MPAMNMSAITVGGPCKITDVATVIYTEGDVVIEPQLGVRPIASAVGGDQDDVLVNLTYKISGVAKPVWNSSYRGVLLPDSLTNFTATGARLIGAANRAVTVLGSDGEQYAFTRAALTKMPNVFLGLGKSLYDGFEYTAFIGDGKAPTDTDAFYTASTGVAWSQSDFPTAHQEALCTLAWGAVTGWSAVFAEEGFTLNHELKLDAVKQGNITVDMKVAGYRAALMYKPQGPTTAQLLTGIGLQGAAAGIGTRLSARANDAVVTGSGISVTVKNAALNRGQFVFSNKQNRHGEWGMVTALTTPGTRLVLA